MHILGARLNTTMTLVGESGGLSRIYEIQKSDAMPGLLCVTTEHGPLYLDPDEEYPIEGNE